RGGRRWSAAPLSLGARAACAPRRSPVVPRREDRGRDRNRPCHHRRERARAAPSRDGAAAALHGRLRGGQPMSTTCGVIGYEELVAYWAGELAEADVDRLDEHLMGCAVCTSASRGVAEIAGALREIVSPFVTHTELESLRALGRRIRENPVGPGERKPVVFDA